MITTVNKGDATDVLTKERVKIDFSELSRENFFTRQNEELFSDTEKEKIRRKSNLESILNYDKDVEKPVNQPVYEQAPAVGAVNFSELFNKIEDVAKTQTVNTAASDEEDTRPTSTTMQFGDSTEVNEMFSELKRTEEKNEKMTARNKLFLAVYAVAVTLILALIVLNSTVLANISKSNAAREAEVTTLQTRLAEAQTSLEAVSNDEYVMNLAENEYNMIRN